MKRLLFILTCFLFFVLSPSPSFATHACEFPTIYIPYPIESPDGSSSIVVCRRTLPPFPPPESNCLFGETLIIDPLTLAQHCTVPTWNNHALPGSGLKCAGFITCLAGIGLPGLQSKFPDAEKGLVGNLISAVIPVILGLAGFLTAIFIVISGIQFITSGGDPKGAAAAKDRLVYALIGFVLIILAFAILQIIDRVFLGGTGVA